MTYGLVSDNVHKKEDTMAEHVDGRTDRHVDELPGDEAGWPALLEQEAGESGANLEERADVRLERFRRAHETVTLPVEELEAFSNDLIRQAQDQERSKGRRYREPEVFSATDELAAVKYAREQGFITKLEAQRKVRKLLRLKGKRTLADQAARRRRAR
jgi:hypothetical protein